VGAGGFGREVLQWARDAWPHHAGKIAGFLSADPRVLDGHAIGLPILGSPDDFTPQPGDGLLLGIGRRGARRRVAEQLESRGGHFLSLVHPSAIVADTAHIGRGTILCPYASVTANARLAAFCLLNLYSMVAHDAVVGAFSVLSPYAGVAGEAAVGEDVFLAMHAFVGPGVRVGNGSVISGSSCALHNVPADTLVYGVPGRHASTLDGTYLHIADQ
jgi:sugar O-acyltransferase (sialic acid O-acetyltransferase NeuD family)